LEDDIVKGGHKKCADQKKNYKYQYIGLDNEIDGWKLE
jgi:hypothetical protein